MTYGFEKKYEKYPYLKNSILSGVMTIGKWLTLTVQWTNSADNKQHLKIFSYFSNKIGSEPHANCPKETICMKCQILFSGKKKKKNISDVVDWNFYPACKMLRGLNIYNNYSKPVNLIILTLFLCRVQEGEPAHPLKGEHKICLLCLQKKKKKNKTNTFTGYGYTFRGQ